MSFNVCGLSDVGAKKDVNQDSFLVETACSANISDVVLACVADGMGGLESGEKASAFVVNQVAQFFETQVPVLIQACNNDEAALISSIKPAFLDFLQDTNERVLNYGKVSNTSLGTTLVCMFATDTSYILFNVGDSRIYEIPDTKNLVQLTKDQSFVQLEIDAGHLTPDDAEKSPKRNILLQCIGATENINPQVVLGEFNKQSTYLLVSDGFRHTLEPSEIAASLAKDAIDWKNINTTDARHKHAPMVVLRHLIDECMMRRERDNITAVLLSHKD